MSWTDSLDLPKTARARAVFPAAAHTGLYEVWVEGVRVPGRNIIVPL